MIDGYKAQIESTRDELEDHLKDIQERIDSIVTRTVDKSVSDTDELLQMEKEVSIAQTCLQICSQSSKRVEQVQLKTTVEENSELEDYPTNHHDPPNHVEPPSIIANGTYVISGTEAVDRETDYAFLRELQ
jgi:hypothetical protein